jgi:hypothetical protein
LGQGDVLQRLPKVAGDQFRNDPFGGDAQHFLTPKTSEGIKTDRGTFLQRER